MVKDTAEVLRTGSWLLDCSPWPAWRFLSAADALDQTRRVGLLKAVGATPRLVAVVLLAEYMALALLAAAVGLASGWLAAPLLADPGAGLVGSAGAPSLTISTVGVVTAVALGVAAVATSRLRPPRGPHQHRPRPGRRGPSAPAHALADRNFGAPARPPAPRVAGGRPTVPRRAVLSTASIFVAVTGIVAAPAARAPSSPTMPSWSA